MKVEDFTLKMLPKGGDYKAKDGIYEILITNIKNRMVYCMCYNGKGKKSLIEIPSKDLEKTCNRRVNKGLILKMIVTNNCQNFDFKFIQRPHMTKRQLNNLLHEYQKKYGDV